MFQFTSKLLKTARPSDELLRSRYNATDQEINLASQVDNDKFLEWVLKNYKKKLIQLPEDGAKLREQLTWFSKMKNSPKFKEKYSPDINQYTPSTLYEAFSSKETSGLQSENQKDKEIINKGSKIVYNQDGVLVYEVHEPKALMLLSSNTNWCTAHEEYAKKYLKKGPNYVVYKEGKPYCQYDPGTRQLMNPEDVSMKTDAGRFGEVVSDPILLELAKVIPAFSKVKSISSFSVDKFRNALKRGDPRELVKICVMKGKRWPEAEPYIMRDAIMAVVYARDVIKGRWPEAEPYIRKSKGIWENYQRFLESKE
jgi:hypothetical protein